MRLAPFFTFFGGKYRAAPRYPAPAYSTVVEPFAGSAGYSLRHHERNVVLVERDPVIAATWRYLLTVEPAAVRRLPLLGGWNSLDELDVEPGARHLIGFWLNKGMTAPCNVPSQWVRTETRNMALFWNELVRERVATQVDAIRHWQLIEGDYTEAPDIEATWFIDPPYVSTGYRYRHGSRQLDYPKLGAWCVDRRGQTIVCEGPEADWLPFEEFASIKGTEGRNRTGVSKEFLWLNNNTL